MGYLDGSSVTVDAILTNYGRRKLAEKGRLGIQYYTFGDTGVDYYLYDPGHPSGANSMGNAITRTPQLEASPDYVVGMRYTLTTMPRTTYSIPKIVADDITVADTTEASKEWIRPQTQKFDERGETYDITIYNAEALSIDTPPEICIALLNTQSAPVTKTLSVPFSSYSILESLLVPKVSFLSSGITTCPEPLV